MGRLHRAYARTADLAFVRPGLFALAVALVMAAAGYLAWTQVPSGFMPRMDEGGFVLDYKAQSGAALKDTDRLLAQVEQIIAATPEVASYSRRTGAQLGGGLSEADEGDYFVRLKGGSRRPIAAVMSEIRARIAAQVPGLEVELIQLMEDLIGDLTAVPQPIEVKLFGNDPAVLEKAAASVGKALGQVDGVVEVVDGLRVAGDAVAIHVDPGLAAQQGLDPEAVSRQVEALIGGTVATRLRVGEQLLDVRVRGPQDLRARQPDGRAADDRTGRAQPAARPDRRSERRGRAEAAHARRPRRLHRRDRTAGRPRPGFGNETDPGKRLRPILMSALIAILTLAPLALGISRGAGLQQPLATAIVFGLSAAVPLVLLFLPAMVDGLGVLRRTRARAA